MSTPLRPTSARGVLITLAFAVVTAWFAPLATRAIDAQMTGVERQRWKDRAKRLKRIMAKGDLDARTKEVDELVGEGSPFCVRLIADGVAVSSKRERKLDKKVSALLERNADLFKRLKINPPQKPGARTKNDEINENMDSIEQMRARSADERAFRRSTVDKLQKMVKKLDDEAQEKLTTDLLKEVVKAKGHYQIALVDVASRIPLVKAIETALSLVKSHRNQLVRLTAIDGLGTTDEDQAAEGLVPHLRDPRWQIKVAVVDALRKLRKKVAIPAMIEAMGREEGRVREDLLSALQEMTGIDKADNPVVWRNWWKENREQPLASMKRKKRGKGKAGQRAARGGTSFYGIQTKSTHIVYILDRSGSMAEPARKPGQTGGGGDGQSSKFEIARRELLKSLDSLPPKATFNVLFYNEAFQVFQDKMVKASKANKKAARDFVDGLNAQGATNIYDTLERAFEIGGQGAVDKAYKPNFDTIFFLTDGSPTAGKTTDTKEILAEVDRWNRAKRIKVHCVGVGAHNSRFMRNLAEKTGGQYTAR